MRVLFLSLLLIMFSGLQLRLWKPEGLLRERNLHLQKIAEQRERNEALRNRNRELTARLARRSGDNPAAVEGRARSQLGMIRRDETFVWIIEEDESQR